MNGDIPTYAETISSICALVRFSQDDHSNFETGLFGHSHMCRRCFIQWSRRAMELSAMCKSMRDTALRVANTLSVGMNDSHEGFGRPIPQHHVLQSDPGPLVLHARRRATSSRTGIGQPLAAARAATPHTTAAVAASSAENVSTPAASL